MLAQPAAGSASPPDSNTTKTKELQKAPAHPQAVVKVGECPVPAIDDTRGAHARDVSDRRYTNLWNRIRAGFRLPRMEGPRVARYEQWFANHPQYVDQMLQRANLYLYQIVQDVSKRNMPMEIALLPAIESAYSPDAYSRSAAIGLWQFEPSTGRLWGLKTNWWYSGERDIIASTNAALDFLQSLHNQFHSWNLALAAYNAGQGTIEAAIAHNQALGLGTHYRDLRLPQQTENYVPKLMAIVNIVRDPAKFGLTLHAIPNSPYFVRVNTGSQIDLSVIARLANMSLKQLYAINPGFTQMATAPNGPHTILVPVATKAALIEGLSQLPPQDRMQWARHVVVPGDTLDGIANEYGVSVAAIRSTNHIYSNFIRVGQNLLIPMAGRRLVVSRSQAAGQEEARGANAIYRVAPGDTLSGIASQYGVSVEAIRAANHIYGSLLAVGQRLVIPGAGQQGVVASAGGPRHNLIYQVAPGDTLYGIARQYGVSVAAIRSTNHIYGSLLAVGQRLVIPGAGQQGVVASAGGARQEVALSRSGSDRVRIIHRVRPGDTLWSIAQRYRVYVSQLERWNVLNAHDVLRLGQRILIWASPAMVPSAVARTRITE